MSLKPSYKVEYAKSNRSACTKCKQSITKDTPRVGKLVKAANFDGVYYIWHHQSCFFKKFGSEIKSSSDINGLDSLRWNDQQKLKAMCGEGEKPEEEEVVFEAGDVTAEYARSGRSEVHDCQGCNKKIANKALRLSLPAESGKGWYHVECFTVPEGLDCIESITGYEDLDDADIDTLEKMIEKAEEEREKAKNNKKGGKQTKESKEEAEEKKRVEKLWKLKDELNRDYTANELKRWLRFNDQNPRGGMPDLVERCADGITNGAIPRCTVCEGGRFSYTNGLYKCHGHLSEWSKCTNVEKEVKRGEWKTPDWDEPEEEYSDDEKSPRTSRSPKRSRKKYEEPVVPFTGWIVALVGSTFEDKASLIELIENNGGEISGNVTKRVTHVITTPEEEAKARKPVKLKNAEKYEIPIHHPEFIENAVETHKKEVNNTNGDEPAKKRQKTERPTSHQQPLVDSFFEKAEQALIVGNESEGYYAATLSRTDLGDGELGKNSFYILQLLKKTNVNTFWLYKRWGRVGDSGTLTFTTYKNKQKAITEFEKTYLKFTANEWDDRFDFEKRPGKYFPVELDYGQDEDAGLGSLATAKSTHSALDPRVANLVATLFDLDMFEQTMKSMDMDVKEMPLGKLSKAQLQRGFDVLKEIKELLNQEATDRTKHLLKDATNRFYTTIPHSFEGGLPPIFSTLEEVRKKIEHLEVLSDMEVATTMLKTNKDASKEDPLMTKYKMLKNDIQPMEKGSEQWKILEDYLNITCQRPKLDVLDIFEVERNDEADRFSKFNSIEKRKLLWHGTRTAVYAAILSGGMKIMPHSGGRVGKGLYFADICSKSASYCGVWGGGEGFLLLSEVALGRIHKINRDDPSIRKAPNGFDSVLATGTIMPDPSADIVDETISISGHKIEIPQGKIINTNLRSTFNHNEFLVYDEGQVHMKYLLKVRWN